MIGRVVMAVALLACTVASRAEDMKAVVAEPFPVAIKVLRETQHIVTIDGIEKVDRVTLGGIPQWISVRGRHRDNPILLFLHGGPGFTMLPASWRFQTPWEEYFTVVQWDQRGAGKTYAENDPTRIAPTLTIARMLADTEELVAYLRRTYDKRKIVLVAHSWGSVLGTKLALEHPGWLYAYVGIGQVVNMRRSEALGYRALLDAARQRNDAEAIRELEALAPYPGTPGPDALKKLDLQRKWLLRAGGYTWRSEHDHYDELVALSPDYRERDIQAWSDGIQFSLKRLWNQLFAIDFLGDTRFGCPVLIFQGRHDLNTSTALAEQWFATLRAPAKKFVWFDDSAHMVMQEEPGKLFVHLVQDVLPLTHGGVDETRTGN